MDEESCYVEMKKINGRGEWDQEVPGCQNDDREAAQGGQKLQKLG